ncbi:MAG: lmo0937 family membrane protein [Candidatus Saccharimonadales bacterium]
MLLIVALVLVAFWILGLFAHIGGGLINLLLVIALVVFIIHMLTGRRAV